MDSDSLVGDLHPVDTCTRTHMATSVQEWGNPPRIDTPHEAEPEATATARKRRGRVTEL